MCDQPGSSKRPSAMPDCTNKHFKTTDSLELPLDSEEDIYLESDNDINYEFDDTESDSESEKSQLQVEQKNYCVSEKQIFLKETDWSNDFSTMRNIPFTHTNVLLVPPPNNPRDYFDLFVSKDYLEIIILCSNKYAENLKNSFTEIHPPTKQLLPLTLEELKIFIGLLLHSSTAKMHHVVDYWKSHRLYKSVFSQYMTVNRFQIILRLLHFDYEQNNTDRLNKCKLITDNFNNVMESIYYPDKTLLLNESMILQGGQLVFRQYINGKRHKYGIKLHTLAEPNGIILKVCASILNETKGKGHREKIVEKLMEGKLNAGHSVFMDQSYNSYSLVAKLLDQNTYCTGTLNKKQIDNLTSLKTKKLKKGENVSLCCNGVHIGKWKDKRKITYISTEFPEEMQKVTTRRGTIATKPAAIINYCKRMSDFHLLDQIFSCFPCEMTPLSCHMKIFIHTLMMSLINAWLLFNKYSNQTNMTFYGFREKVIESFLPEIIYETETIQKTSEVQPQHKLTKIEKAKPRCLSTGQIVNATSRKDCRNCYKNKRRVNTTTECKICPGAPPLCVDCFFELHDCIVK